MSKTASWKAIPSPDLAANADNQLLLIRRLLVQIGNHLDEANRLTARLVAVESNLHTTLRDGTLFPV